EGPRLDGRGGQGREGLRAVRDAEEAQHVREDPGRLDPHLPDAVPDLSGDHLRAVALDEPEVRPQDVENREVGDGGRVRLASPLRERPAPLGLAEELLAELVEEARFPQAGLAEQAHDLAAAPEGVLESAPQEADLPGASHEGAAARAGSRAAPR